MVEFSDGKEIDNRGDYRVVEAQGQWYVAGEGLLFPAESEGEAQELLAFIQANGIFIAMKLFRSPKRRENVPQDLQDAFWNSVPRMSSGEEA